jgi:hypothetical protein
MVHDDDTNTGGNTESGSTENGTEYSGTTVGATGAGGARPGQVMGGTIGPGTQPKDTADLTLDDIEEVGPADVGGPGGSGTDLTGSTGGS